MKSDGHGTLIKPKQFKLYGAGSTHTWNMKLSQIGRPSMIDRNIYIATYSLPRLREVMAILQHRPTGRLVHMVCHEKFHSLAKSIRGSLPDIKIRVHPAMHAKFCIIEPETIFLGSANFGNSKWIECMVGVKSAVAVQEYICDTWQQIWNSSSLI